MESRTENMHTYVRLQRVKVATIAEIYLAVIQYINWLVV